MFLNCHSEFSYRFGTMSVKTLTEEAIEKGAEAIALTDVNNTSACLDFVREARIAGVKPIVGVDFRNGNEQLYIGLAQNMRGFRELNAFLSRQLHAGNPMPERPPEFFDAAVIFPWGKISRPDELRDNEYVGIKPGELNKLFASPFRHRQDKLVILYPVTFRDKTGFNLHRLLRAVNENTLLSRIGPEDAQSPDAVMRPAAELMQLYRSYPQIITNTLRLLDECNFEMDLNCIKNKRSFTGSRYDDKLLVEKLAEDGLRGRYGPGDREARTRVEREITIIDQLGFSAYFLITWDFIRYAQSRGFFHVGRGSGANSIVAYCLGITDVDPIELDLYFERFLNPHRTSPPDFDIDFSWTDRDEVIEYIFRRYGKDHTVLLGSYNTFQGRSVIRELGKVFGLPKSEIDMLVELRKAHETPDHIARLIHHYGKLMQDMPNHLSIHPGGILITEEPIFSYTATEIPPKGFPVTQFDMYVAEDAGLHKYDVLSQRGLGHIKDAAGIVKRNQRIYVDVHDVPSFKRDERIRELLRRGRTLGCFYVESPAMRQLLRKLECDDYIGLVAASSIIRPGVARSGSMRQYIERKHNPHGFEYLHPKMEELLKETYGVMVYQEDVIKVAHHFGGLGLAEGDVLRRIMSGKKRDLRQLDAIRDQYFENCRGYGYKEEVSQEVWRLMESFSGYSFCKAHSASYAVESYQSLFFKAYFPLEFMVAVINNFGGFYSTEIYVHEARMAGGNVHAPCINHSEVLTSITGKDIWLGFVHLKGFDAALAREIAESRTEFGPFRHLDDLLRRTPMTMEQLSVLIRAGALRFTGKSKKRLLWEAGLHFSDNVPKAQKSVLFDVPEPEYTLPVLPDDPTEDAYDELELLGFTLRSPFELLREMPPQDTVPAHELPFAVGKRVEVYGYLVCIKHVRTIRNELMYFGTFVDRIGGFIDTTHFPQVALRYPFKGTGVYRISGRVTEDFGMPSLEVEFMQKLPYKVDPRVEG